MKKNCIFLILILLLAGFGQVKAQFSGGTGTSTNPYLISKIADLVEIRVASDTGNNFQGMFFKMTADINMDVLPYNSGDGWYPIGYSSPFSGSFDGNGKKITGLFISSGFMRGLFSDVVGGTIKNLGIENVNIWVDDDYVGAIAAYIDSTEIINCYSTGKIIGVYSNVGGLVGYAENKSSFTNSYSKVSVFTDGSYSGGIVGFLKDTSTIKNCYSTSDVRGHNIVGGIVGYVESSSKILNSYSTGFVQCVDGSIGGIAGVIGADCLISDCFSTSNVNGNSYSSSYIGGIAGYLYDNATVKNCYSTGNVIGGPYSAFVGGIVGYSAINNTIKDCAALNPSVKGNSSAGRILGFDNGSITLNGNIAFDNIFDIYEQTGGTAWSYIAHNDLDGEDISKAIINTDGTIGGLFAAAPWTTQAGKLPALGNTLEMPLHLHEFTVGVPYLIKTIEELRLLSVYVNGVDTDYADKKYKLANDLDNNGEYWLPIGNASNPFKGNFDGDNKTIQSIYIYTSGNYKGLFGYVENATIANITLNGNITGDYYVGSVAGYVDNSTINKCYYTGTVEGVSYIGGIAGYVNNHSNISNSYSKGHVNGGSNIGGISGYIENHTTINKCYSNCEINTTSNYIGGIVGTMADSTYVNYCYYLGNINAYMGRIGGVVGQTHSDCIINNCYTTGEINTLDDVVGGIAGYLGSKSTITNSAALNKSVINNISGTVAGRIAAMLGGNNSFSNNIAFAGLLNTANDTTLWTDKIDTMQNGANISANTINTDGTLNNNFNTTNWIIKNGYLPSLFGETVEIPYHILIETNLFDSGTGDTLDPYIIKTPTQLRNLARVVNNDDINYNDKHYLLYNDINIGTDYGTNFNDGKGWMPIGNEDEFYMWHFFYGHFNGNNKKVTNLIIKHDNYINGSGLFGFIAGAYIENLAVTNIDIDVPNNSSVGGVVGKIDSYSIIGSTLKNCSSAGKINGYNNVGGIIGIIDISSTITDCNSSVNVSGFSNIGAVIGYAYDSITLTNCYSTGDVSGIEYVGGIIGAVEYNSNITNCHSSGEISGYFFVGGIAGTVEYFCNITNCHSSGKVSGKIYNIGGVAGYIYNSCNIKNCYSNGNISGTEDIGGIVGSTYDNCTIDSCNVTGTITGYGYYVGGITGYAQNSNITNSHSKNTISGFGSVGGVIGHSTSSGTIENCSSTGNIIATGSEVGGVVGSIYYINLIINCYSEGNISAKDYAGGIVGNAYNSDITNCYSTGDVNCTENYIGGIAGYLIDNNITNCYSTGNVTGMHYVAGLVGYAETNCNINSSYSDGNVIANENVGGIAGYVNNNIVIEDCYSLSKVTAVESVGGIVGRINDNVTVKKCYATNAIEGEYFVGGIVGTTANTNILIDSCAALNPSVIANSGHDFGRIVGNDYGSPSLSNNLAWNIMFDGTDTVWISAHNGINGLDITREEVNYDGTINGYFMLPIWTSQNGALPAFGNTVVMPIHLRIPGAVYINTPSLPDGTINFPYNQQILADGDPIIVWTVTNGYLPTGLTLNSSTGVISGTPTEINPFTFTIKAENDINFDTRTYTININNVTGVTITTLSVPNGEVNKLYVKQLTAIAPTSAITWTLEGSSTLPAGLTLSAAGLIAGIPLVATTIPHMFTVRASHGSEYDTKTYTIVIAPSTSIDEYLTDNKTDNITIFPNPTTGQLSIKNLQLEMNNSKASNFNCAIYDISGRIVSQFAIPNSQFIIPDSEFLIDISHLTNGMYYIRIGNETVKVIKE